jgi:hypothetical protein
MLPERWKKCVDFGGGRVVEKHVQVVFVNYILEKKNQSRSYLNHLE